MDILMSKEEILRSFKEAKNKTNQIKVLADMNCTTSKEMRNWLIENGAEVPEDKRFKNNHQPKNKDIIEYNVKEDETLNKSNSKEIPDSIRKILAERRSHLLNNIRKMQSEVDDIDSFIGRN